MLACIVNLTKPLSIIKGQAALNIHLCLVQTRTHITQFTVFVDPWWSSVVSFYISVQSFDVHVVWKEMKRSTNKFIKTDD